jgi:hypothetical protein
MAADFATRLVSVLIMPADVNPFFATRLVLAKAGICEALNVDRTWRLDYGNIVSRPDPGPRSTAASCQAEPPAKLGPSLTRDRSGLTYKALVAKT